MSKRQLDIEMDIEDLSKKMNTSYLSELEKIISINMSLPTFDQKMLNFVELSSRDDISIEFIMNNLHLPWSFNTIQQRRKLSVDDINTLLKKNIHVNFYRLLSENPNLTLDILKAFHMKNWDTYDLSKNPGLTMEWITTFPDWEWDYSRIMCNPSLALEILKLIPDEKLNFYSLSENPGLKIEWIMAYPKGDWRYKEISYNPSLTLEIMEALPNGKELWDLNALKKQTGPAKEALKQYIMKHF